MSYLSGDELIISVLFNQMYLSYFNVISKSDSHCIIKVKRKVVFVIPVLSYVLELLFKVHYSR